MFAAYCAELGDAKTYDTVELLNASDVELITAFTVELPTVMELFTPTIIQVAAGVLAGLSWIMEPKNENKGLLKPTQLYTPYILSKSIPLLGKFFFTEIPAKSLNKSTIKFEIDKIV